MRMYINIGDTDSVVSGLHQVNALFAKHAIVVLSQPDRGRSHAMRQLPTQTPLDAFVPLTHTSSSRNLYTNLKSAFLRFILHPGVISIR
jgi:hypothetical protein